jgi:SAM-dependent methyltransferase
VSVAAPISAPVPPPLGPPCPVCGAATATILSTAEQTATDLAFALARGDKLMHDYASDVFDCASCGTLFRDPSSVPGDLVARYRDDAYERAELERLWRRGLDRCRRTADDLVDLGLRPGTSVLEIGSYAGAFLTFVRELGCDGVGVDIGRDVTAFAHSRGLEVLDGPFSASSFRARRFDSVWILNCFEQLPDVDDVLDGAAALLEPGGRLVIRTPNADFVRAAYRRNTGFDRRLLAVNGLLGVPFSKCLNLLSLLRLLAEHRFDSFRVHGYQLLPDRRTGTPARRSPWIDVGATLRDRPRQSCLPGRSACTASIGSASVAALSSR